MSNKITPMPAGFGMVLDADTKQLDDTTLFGGSPARLIRLSTTGRQAWSQLRDGPVHSTEAGMLARRLTDAGLAHPAPPAPKHGLDVTVIVPVRDRAALLDRCLAALGRTTPVIVVDDGSADPVTIAAVADRHGAKLVRRAEIGGPGRARNTGIECTVSEFVAFLDSDCVAPAGWIDRIGAHFTDPLVGAAAPRILATASRTSAGRYAAIRGSLDLGNRAARVRPATRVAYVPTAALVVRRSALSDVALGANVFDPALRYGEDVDLIWRLDQAGWRIRYDPSVQVKHHEPDAWIPLLIRRFHYGTSAAPLSRRHCDSIAPMLLQPWAAAVVAAMLARRPLLAGGALATSVLAMNRKLRRAGVPSRGVLPAMGTTVYQTWLGIGRYSTQLAAPLLAVALAAPGRPNTGRARTRGRRAASASLLLGPALATWVTRRRSLNPIAFVAACTGDDLAYGAGVWAGCLRARTVRPVLPRIASRSSRIRNSIADRTEGSLR